MINVTVRSFIVLRFQATPQRVNRASLTLCSVVVLLSRCNTHNHNHDQQRLFCRVSDQTIMCRSYKLLILSLSSVLYHPLTLWCVGLIPFYRLALECPAALYPYHTTFSDKVNHFQSNTSHNLVVYNPVIVILSAFHCGTTVEHNHSADYTAPYGTHAMTAS